MFKATLNGSIPQTTISLVQLRAGQIVGSTYHTVRQTGHLRQAGETEERITAVASWRDVPYFTDAERVAPELVEAVLTPIRSGSACETELLGAGAERARQEGHGAALALTHLWAYSPTAARSVPSPVIQSPSKGISPPRRRSR
jgi:alkylhydroperoxidase family enzyme